MYFCNFSEDSPAARKDNAMHQITTLRRKQKLQDERGSSKWKCMERPMEQVWQRKPKQNEENR